VSDALLTQLRGRDPSICLALAALIRCADEQGASPFGTAAVAFREDYLVALSRSAGDAGPADPGTLSVDDVRRHLATSVLPRLATEAVILDPGRGWTESSVVQFQPEAWSAVGADRDGARQQLLEAAWQGMVTHDRRRQQVAGSQRRRHDDAPLPDTGEHPVTSEPGMPASSVLEAFGLRKTYSRRAVVDDVNVRLGQGEIVGLLGPNGAGKTTTFYMMVGLIAPEAGRIELDGEDISTLPMYLRARRGVGYLAQEPSVFRKLTVEENLLAILETLPIGHEERLRRLEGLLDDLSIRHLRRNKAYSLSGGERRRLEITRALVTRPKFMLLDEPFSGVDPIAVHDIQTIVAGLRHKGIGVLITDHNVEQTLDIVDRAYIMFEGKVQVSGTVRALVFDDRVAELYLGPTLTARLRSRLSPAA
jgi:lipopolysaccharide export system ATP-binding protein